MQLLCACVLHPQRLLTYWVLSPDIWSSASPTSGLSTRTRSFIRSRCHFVSRSFLTCIRAILRHIRFAQRLLAHAAKSLPPHTHPRRFMPQVCWHKCAKILEKMPLHENLEPGLMGAMSLALHRVVYVQGDYILREGEIGKDMYFVAAGEVQVVTGPPDRHVEVTRLREVRRTANPMMFCVVHRPHAMIAPVGTNLACIARPGRILRRDGIARQCRAPHGFRPCGHVLRWVLHVAAVLSGDSAFEFAQRSSWRITHATCARTSEWSDSFTFR
jgi:hypothetical protein